MSIDIKTNTDGTAKGNFSEVVTPIIAPASDSITAIQITKADGLTLIAAIDTINKRLGINKIPTVELDVLGSITASGLITGNLIGSASLNVLKSGDMMTGNLIFGNLTIGITGNLISFGTSILIGANGAFQLSIGTQDSSRVSINNNNLFFELPKPTSGEPNFSSGGKYFNTTLNKGMIGGVSAFEVIQSQPKTPTALTPGASISLDPTANSTFTLAPGGNETINAASVATYGQIICIIFTSRAVADVITLGTNFKSTGTLTMAGVAGKIHTMSFVSDGTNYNELSRTTGM